MTRLYFAWSFNPSVWVWSLPKVVRYTAFGKSNGVNFGLLFSTFGALTLTEPTSLSTVLELNPRLEDKPLGKNRLRHDTQS